MEAALLDCHANASSSDEKEKYARLLNTSTAYLPKRSRRELLSVEESAPKEKEEPPAKVELKPLPAHLRYAFLDPSHQCPVIVNVNLDGPQLEQLLDVLRKHRGAIGYSIDDIRGLSPTFCMHRIFLDDSHCPSRQPQRRLNPNMQEVVKNEILKLLDAGIIYPISDSEWVSPVQVVPKKGGMTVIKNERDELISTRTVTGWRMCID